jgi:hypothetical protein
MIMLENFQLNIMELYVSSGFFFLLRSNCFSLLKTLLMCAVLWGVFILL